MVVDHYISTLYAHIIQRFDVPTDRPARDLPLNHNESMNEPLNQFGEPNETESESETETKRTERQRQLRNESVKFILKLKQKKQQQQQKDRVLFYVFVQNAQRAAPRPAPRRHP